MTDIPIPKSGDFAAWQKSSDACIAIDWDGTCKDTMIPKWTQGFNLATTEVWPELKPWQKEIDDICYQVNLVEPTAGVQRFVALKIMMARWREMGLPTPDLSRFFAAVERVESKGEKHGLETYQRLQKEFGYDDAPLRWSDVSDRFIAAAVKTARVFSHCEETLRAVCCKADLVVVSASKTEAVRQDLVDHRMADLFKALCAQDFLPKRGILQGLVKKYPRVLFLGDTQEDVRAALAARVPLYLIKVGREDASWAAAPVLLEKFIAGEQDLPGLIYP
jgi:phosphoglycolate phosphatase-like HAD superfamily hydrolase